MYPPSKPLSFHAKMIEALEPRQLLSTTISVAGTDDPWTLAGVSGPGAGTAPAAIHLPSGTNRSINFPSITGTVSGNTSLAIKAGPDGYTSGGFTTNITGVRGLSGIIDTASTGAFALLGVFTGNTIPASGAPATLNYANTRSAASTSPLLDQLFFIGDGKTGTGSGALQKINIPSGATRLYLGFGDSQASFHGPPGAYGDDGGKLTVSYGVTYTPQYFAVTGSVLKDVNGAAGPGLADWRVYVDNFHIGRYDANDAATTTDANGNFTIQLQAGTYTLAVEIQNGYAIAQPSTYTYAITVGGNPVRGLRFVLKPISTGL